MGSSYKNTGVQPLMDAIIRYLPSPSERTNDTVSLYAPHLCAMAFKIIHDNQRGGVLTFIRIYSGQLEQVWTGLFFLYLHLHAWIDCISYCLGHHCKVVIQMASRAFR